MKSEFIIRITECTLENLSNEQFGVSELSEKIGMSRSNLLRRIKSETGKSASQFIRQVRLEEAMTLLSAKDYNVSEVSHQVGFSSTSYFIKCFREHYGYPPGEVGKKPISSALSKASRRSYKPHVLIGAVVIFVISFGALWIYQPDKPKSTEKSIAILPFKNDSNDSSNIYLINGLMESTLSHLQKIKDLRVVSRTSVEKYRGSSMSIPEIAKELPVGYFVEGSGQKVDNKILLNIQLIEASTDRHIWSRQYHRQVTDIFQLQQEIAKNIAREIEVAITPAEEERIDQIPTANLDAYDSFLKGVEIMNTGGASGLQEAISYYEKAIKYDPEFGVAYGNMAICYYYMDFYQADKKFVEKVNSNADKALLYDPKALESLTAKAYYYIQIKEYELAIPYLERAHEFYPNSAHLINMMSNFYTNNLPNTAKYLEYALKGIRLEVGVNDSLTNSYLYLHLSNALIQNGFVKEANKYIDVSLDYSLNNYYSDYLKVFIRLAQHGDMRKAEQQLLVELAKDTTRVDITQDIAKLNFYMRDYERAFEYYKRFLNLREKNGLDVFQLEDLKVGITYEKMGYEEEAQYYIEEFKNYVDNDRSIYKDLSLMSYYAYVGDTTKAIEHLRLFTEEENYPYWIVLFLELDPECENLVSIPEVQGLMDKIKKKFWKGHDELEATLKEQGLI
ncbi:MAG: helix-turn-helix domain-containing protein [Marinoscillum sp.]